MDVEPIKGGDVLANNGLTTPEKPPEEDRNDNPT